MSRRGLPSLDEGLASITRSTVGLHFNPDEWDKLIEQHGTCSRVRRAVACPCLRADTRTPAMGCQVCRGMGWAYPDSLELHIEVLLSGRTGEVQLQPVGAVTHGGVASTWKTQVRADVPLVPARGDQVLPEGEQHTVQELVIRGGMADLSDRYSLSNGPEAPPPPLPPDPDRLLYPGEVVIEWAGYRDPVTGGLVELVEGEDFEIRVVDDQGFVAWLGDRGPAVGTGASFRYRAPAAYIVHTAVPAVRVEAGARLPYKAQLARLDRWADTDLR